MHAKAHTYIACEVFDSIPIWTGMLLNDNIQQMLENILNLITNLSVLKQNRIATFLTKIDSK